MKLKPTQLTPKEVEKILYALELAYSDSHNWDELGMKLATKIGKAKIVIIAK